MLSRTTTIFLSLLIAMSTYAQNENSVSDDLKKAIEEADANKMAETFVSYVASRDFAVTMCEETSLVAREIMSARQSGRPMSETLPMALDRSEDVAHNIVRKLLEVMVIAAGVPNAPIDDMLSENDLDLPANMDIGKFLDPMFSELVVGAYESPKYSHDELRQDAISDFENSAFASCYESWPIDQDE